jgi:hypothetical protein
MRKHPEVVRPYRQFAVAQPGKNLPDRTLVERDTETLLQFVTQIDPPPTHDPVHRGIGTGLDKRGQFGLLPRRGMLKNTGWPLSYLTERELNMRMRP